MQLLGNERKMKVKSGGKAKIEWSLASWQEYKKQHNHMILKN